MIIKKDTNEILSYLEDASNLKGNNIEGVFIPNDEKEVKEIVKKCNSEKTPLSVSAGGTGTVGGRIAFEGYVLSMERLNNIIEINKEKKYAILQSGVVISEFLKELSNHHLFYPPFPTERTAFIGGNIATNASGEYSFKFGSTRAYVRRIKVVLPDGNWVNIKRGEVFAKDGWLEIPSTTIKFKIPDYRIPNIKKNSAGYYSADNMDLIDLFIGSEGTLGVIVESEVTLTEEIPNYFFCAAFLKSPEDTFSMITEIRKRKDILDKVLCLEYFDENSLQLLKETYPKILVTAKECILFAGKMDSDESLDMWEKLLEDSNFVDSWFAETEKQKEELFKFRHKLPEIINDLVRKNNQTKISTDIVVPEDKFWQMKSFYNEKLGQCNVQYVIFGHIGEYHLHCNLLPRNEKEKDISNKLHIEFAQKAVEFGGTISGEHGIGKTKHHLLKIMYGEEGVNEMVRVKKTIDTNYILGVDNIFSKEK